MKVFCSGNIAIALGALAAGVDFYAGYPITPSSDIMEYMAQELPKRGGVFIQAEDEISAIFMLIGASWGGAKAMTATSGPGFSLMQEGIGIAVMTETPLLIVNVMRCGPATGQASKAAQGDIMQARWGRHGDQMVVVYAPSTTHECFWLTVKAVETAERLRVPVILLSDELIAHTWESIDIKERIKISERPRPDGMNIPPFGSRDPKNVPPMPPLGKGFNVVVTGSTHDKWGFRHTTHPEVHRELVTRLLMKVKLNLDWISEYEIINEGAEIGIIAYGSTARSASAAIKILNNLGVNVSLFKLKSLWPLPEEALKEFLDNLEIAIVPELNLGQLIYDVERLADRGVKVYKYSKIGGGIPIYPEELVDFILKIRR